MCQCDGDSKTSTISKKKPDKRGNGKEFVIRDSHYTILLKNDQIRSVYHICVAIFICVLLDSITHDLLTSGRIYLGLRTIKKGFGKIHIGLAVWGLMHVQLIGLYYALQIWAQVLRNLTRYIPFQNVWNLSCIACFTAFQLNLLYAGTMACVRFDFPFATSAAMLMETYRLMMKSYAFVRTNVPRMLSEKSLQLDPMASYIYYLFAPTFIYRNSYPRTKKIRWTFALMNLLEVVSTIFLLSVIYERYCSKNFENFGIEEYTTKGLVDKVFAMLLPASMMMLSTGYMILHSWLNFTGEILRFGDRMYYLDWWTSASYEAFYRTWNVVVHEWFYEFIYKDAFKYVFRGSKQWSSLFVFYLSAVMHEHVVGFAIRMHYPVLFVFFGGVGVIFFFLTNKLPKTIGKVFFWCTFFIGITLIVCLYAMEFYARKNVMPVNSLDWIPVSSSYKLLTEYYS